MDVKNKVGRPLAFKSVEELQKKIDEYFHYCDSRTKTIFDPKTHREILIVHPAPYTMSGLARYLGVDRDTLVNYSHKEEFFGTIREAREKVHEDVETRMMETKNERGAMFSLKNNFGWQDKQVVEQTSPDLEGIKETIKDIDAKLGKQVVENTEPSKPAS